MTSTTTLMTFRVRTPPTTRNVQLYGSWDNFALPYPMQRDVRLGAEHWSGCHSFANIICDGRVYGRGESRQGALRMGGTYWYYYKLDDDLEFHNSAEPSTTVCPMLPGQLVNVLQVPVALSGSHHRKDSVSSTSSDQHTLNPEDRFMNPRPVPTPPPVMRVNTSTGLPSLSYSGNSSPTSVSQHSLSRCISRENLHVSNMHRLPHMPSSETLGRRGRVGNKTTGLRQAFKTFRSGRSQSPESRYNHIVEWIPNQATGSTTSLPQTPESDSEATSYFEHSKKSVSPQARQDLLLRSTSETSIPTASFLEHRRERSRSGSRGLSSLRSSLIVDESGRYEIETQRSGLDTLVEVASPEYVLAPPSLPGTVPQDTPAAPLQVNKRLPTLPNTPSSAYPVTADPSMTQTFEQQLAGLSSHFSATTINTEHRVSSIVSADCSRFSGWSMASADFPSPVSDMTTDDLSSSPDMCQEDFFVESVFASSAKCSTRHSRASTASSMNKSHPGVATFIGSFQHYKLPESDFTSGVTLKHVMVDSNIDTSEVATPTQFGSRVQTETLRDRRSGFPHSQTMQDLMNELSYLSEAITQG